MGNGCSTFRSTWAAPTTARSAQALSSMSSNGGRLRRAGRSHEQVRQQAKRGAWVSLAVVALIAALVFYVWER